MARPPKLRLLSIFLLKEDVETFEGALRADAAVEWQGIRPDSGVDGTLAVRSPEAKVPWWRGFVAPHLEDRHSLDRLTNASTAAVLFLVAADRRWAITFGHGRHLLDPEAYSQDFGLRVVLNTVEPVRLRSVDARTFDELTVHTRRDVSRGSALEAFGLDVTRDLLRAVTGPPRDMAMGERITGSDAAAVATRVVFGDVPKLCGELLSAYGADVYKEHFGFIDHLRPVRDPARVASLDETLVAAIQANELTDIHLAPPEPMDWSKLAGFTYSTRPDDEVDPDPRISAYRDTFDNPEEVQLGDLKRDRVVAVGAEGGHPLERWPVYRCVVFEASDGDLLFVLTAGHWYSVSQSFADEVADFARALPELNIELPEAALGMTEGDYNRDAAQHIGALCADRELVSTPSGDRIELCDLLTSERQFVHVKRRGSSSTLSHLFSQGIVSAELLLREGTFRDEARRVVSALDDRFAEIVPAERPEPGTCEVGFVVITRSTRTTPLTLPFFSLVNLRSAALRLRDLGFRVTVKKVLES